MDVKNEIRGYRFEIKTAAKIVGVSIVAKLESTRRWGTLQSDPSERFFASFIFGLLFFGKGKRERERESWRAFHIGYRVM